MRPTPSWPDELDALTASPEHHSLVFENSQVRVLDARIPAGARTAVHTHKWAAVHTILSASAFVRRDEHGQVLLDSRTLPASALAGPAWWSAPLGPHSLENVGTQELRVLSVELKAPAPIASPITRLDHFQLTMPAGGEEKARAFFRDALGMTEEPKPAPLAARGGCWFAADGAKLHVSVERNFTPQKKGHPAFCMRDLEAVADRLTKGGWTVAWDDTLPDRKRFFSADPFGNRLEFLRDGDGFSQR